MPSPETSRIAGGPAPPRSWPGCRIAGLSRRGLLAFLLASPPWTQAAPLEVYGRLPHLEDFALSPDGSRVAFVGTDGDARTVAVMSIADRTVLRRAHVGDKKLRELQWADNDRLLIVTSATTLPYGLAGDPGEWFQMAVFDLKKGALIQVPPAEESGGVSVMNTIIGSVMVRRLGDHTVLFIPGLQVSASPGMGLPGLAVPALIRFDLETQRWRVTRVGKSGTLGCFVDEAGEVQAEETYVESERRWSIFLRDGGRLREVASGKEDIEFPKLIGWGPTPGTLLLQLVENGSRVWKLMSLTDGTIAPMEGSEALNRPIEHPLSNRMVGGVRVGDFEEYVFFDPSVQRGWDRTVQTFPGEHVFYESASADFRKFIVRIEGAKHGLVYALVDLDARHAAVLGAAYEGVEQLLEVRRIDYTARDGQKIPAYLTLPRAKAPQGLPLVVLPHGGPARRDTAEFNWWPQALADQGYAVLQPNYRGSNSTRVLLEAGFGEWGRKMQTDLSDGVRYLAKEGIVDPTRVCIVGASYGGYAALAGPSLDPGVYRCAVAVAGIGDLKRMLKSEGRESASTQRYWDRFMGVSGPDDPALDTISPIRHINAISVPILLIHGKDDTVVPFEQSQLMYDALRNAKKDVQLVTLKKEDHWLSRGETRLQMLESSVAFLRAHNPPD